MGRPLRLSLIAVLIFSALSAQAATPETVRVRILAKFHPRSVLISETPGESLRIDLQTALPVELVTDDALEIFEPISKTRRRYPGRIIIEREGDELLIINELPLQDYVTSVTLSELGWQAAEAMRAQAVVARTWAVSHIREDKAYDFGDLTNSQVYKGLFPQSAATHRLLDEIGERIVTYKNQPIEALYHADCPERVYSAYAIWGARHTPYLADVDLPLSDTPKPWRRELSLAALNGIFSEYIDGQSARYTQQTRDARLGVSINDHWLGVDEFRLRVNRVLGWNRIRSNAFTLQQTKDSLMLEGEGHGHLVGLCQKRAVALAKQGWGYEQILRLFYPGAALEAP